MQREESGGDAEESLRRRAFQEKREREALEKAAEEEKWKAKVLARHQEVQRKFTEEKKSPQKAESDEDDEGDGDKETREMLESVSPCSAEDREAGEPDAEPAAAGLPPTKKARKRGKRKSTKLGNKERRERRLEVPGEHTSADFEGSSSSQECEADKEPEPEVPDGPADAPKAPEQ